MYSNKQLRYKELVEKGNASLSMDEWEELNNLEEELCPIDNFSYLDDYTNKVAFVLGSMLLNKQVPAHLGDKVAIYGGRQVTLCGHMMYGHYTKEEWDKWGEVFPNDSGPFDIEY